jgi:putrescine aminotransferase
MDASGGVEVSAQPFATREETAAAFAAHVNRGKARVLESLGIEIVVGEREGPRFRDAYSGRWYWNCHGNGGVFNLGHRHPRVVAAVREGLDHLDVGNHHPLSG